MGSWSEGCGLSGLELDDLYVVFLKSKANGEHGPASYFTPMTFPLKGTYDDYGNFRPTDRQEVCDLFCTMAGINPSKMITGDTFDPRDDASEYHMFFIDADVFESLGRIPREFAYNMSDNQIKTSVDSWMKKITDQVKVDLEDDRFDDIDMPDGKKFDMSIFWKAPEDIPYDDRKYKNMLMNIMKKGAPEPDLALFIEIYSRSATLGIAMTELRKRFVPSTHVGPQHSGEKALIEFYNIVAPLAAKRLSANIEDEIDEDND